MFGYYDLIELPGGGHIPVPIAVELVGEKEVKRIPISRRKRDNTFFFCPECGMLDFFKHRECDHCHSDLSECENCKYEKELKESYRLKELVFVHLVRSGKHRKMRYIRAKEVF